MALTRRQMRDEGYDRDAIREQFTQPMGEPEPLVAEAMQPANPMPAQQAIARATDPSNQRTMSGTGIAPAAAPATPRSAAAGVGSSAAGGGPSGAIPGAAGYQYGAEPQQGAAPGAAAGAPGAEGGGASAPAGDNSGGMASGYDYIPGAEEVKWGDTSRLSGFNTNEWGEGGSEGYDEFSYKNTFGKIASRYDPTPDSARQIFSDPDFKKMFPRAELIDHPTDPKIKFEPGDPPVDVLIKSGEGGWGWQPEGGEGGGAGMMMPGQVPGDLGGIIASGEGDILAEIQKQLASTAQGRTPFLDDALTKEFSA